MPLTEAGNKVRRRMREEYGTERGDRIFYSKENKDKKFRQLVTGHAKRKASWWAERLAKMPPQMRVKLITSLKSRKSIAWWVSRLNSFQSFCGHSKKSTLELFMKTDQPPKYETTWNDLRIEIEYPVGSQKVWRHENEVGITTFSFPYGYVLGSKAMDGDSVDVYLGPTESVANVYVVRQLKPDSGKIDEPKLMMGFHNEAEAKDIYLKHMGYREEFFGGIIVVPVWKIKRLLQESETMDVLIKGLLNYA